MGRDAFCKTKKGSCDMETGMTPQQLYEVPVTNEHTGERRTMVMSSTSAESARVEALERAFYLLNWRRASASRIDQVRRLDA
jgi:hypothetical protein